MMNIPQEKESLGFLFGYKDSTSSQDANGQAVVNVSFKMGISPKFPKKFKNCKDFWAEEIFVGQTSELYINLDYFKQAFDSELKIINKDLQDGPHSVYQQAFTQRRFYFDYAITLEQFTALNAFSMAHLHVSYQQWENSGVLAQALKNCIGQAFKDDSRPLIEIYDNFSQVSEYIYNKEVEQSLSVKKAKP